MIASYILILCLSTMFASWAGLRLWSRMAPLLNLAGTHTGLGAIIPVIAFLIVVAAPPSLLFFASALIAIFLLRRSRAPSLPRRGIWLAIAIAGILFFLNPPPIALPASVPMAAVYAASFALWLAVSVASNRHVYSLPETAMASIFACLPLAATPLLLGHASSIATDAAILASGWLGAVLAMPRAPQTGLPAQLANALILGYLQIAAVWQGAWETGAASAALWLGGLLYARHCATARTLEELTRA